MAASVDLLERLHTGDAAVSRPLESIYKSLDSVITTVNAGVGGWPLPMGMYWSWTEGMPTSDVVMLRPVVTASGKTTQIMTAAEVMGTKGFVTSLQGFANNDPGGTWVLTLYKNGKSMGLTCSSKGTKANVFASPKKYTYVAGDVLVVYIRGSSASINQSFSASINIESQA